MSGRQQHYLPQFLQRAFAYEERGGEAYVAVYRKGGHGPIKSNTRGVGQQRDFYGKTGDQSVDEAITLGESRLAKIVRALDNDAVGCVPAQDIAVLYGALSMRTKATRDALQNLVPSLLTAIHMKVRNQDEIKNLLRQGLNDDSAVTEAVEAELAKRPSLSRAQRRYARNALRRRIKSEYRNSERQRVEELRTIFDNALAQLREQASAMGNRAFLQGLQRDPLMPERARDFAEFKFGALRSDEAERFVLGDCAVWAVYSDGERRLALGDIDTGVQIEQIVLPISPHRCIIGTRDGIHASMSVRHINETSAALSLELFVSNDLNGSPIRSLQPLIGTALPYFSDDTFMQLLQ